MGEGLRALSRPGFGVPAGLVDPGRAAGTADPARVGAGSGLGVSGLGLPTCSPDEAVKFCNEPLNLLKHVFPYDSLKDTLQ